MFTGRKWATWFRMTAAGLVAAVGLWAKTAQGVVVDSEGAPVGGATVLLKGQSDSSVRSYVTQPDGTFTFVGLNPDFYYKLRARAGKQESSEAEIGRFDNGGIVKVQLRFSVPSDQLKQQSR